MKKFKKIFLGLLIIPILFMTGCGKSDDKAIRDKFIKEIENLKSYYLEGDLTLTNNDDTYKYDVEVSYTKDNFFKVTLTNQNNNYKQTILRNNDGVYVTTPSLNKSFKFQSEWPYNNSQSYLLQSIAKDLKNDENYTFEQKDKQYIFKTKVNYPNNPNYVSQNIILDEGNNLKKVEVLDKNDIPVITFNLKSLDKKATFDSKYFDLKEENTTTDNDKDKDNNNDNTKDRTSENDTKQTINEALFPLYLPENTALSNKEVIATTDGERVIMTFSGDNPFILVQETTTKEDELTIIPTYGEPFLLVDTVGSLTDMSYTWTSNGIEYYIVSDVMSTKELLEVAKSINVVSTINEK